MKNQSPLVPKLFTLFLAAVCATTFTALADSLTVQVDKPGIKLSPMFYGLMTEEINHSYDGGLYAELIRNRVFKDAAANPQFWSVVQADGAAAKIAIDSSVPLNASLDRSLRLDVASASEGNRAGVANAGYWGIPVKPDSKYTASFYAKAAPGFSGAVTVAIESLDGTTVYAQAKVADLGSDWKAYSATLTTGKVEPTTRARFVLTVDHPGTLWLNLVSLFPPTYHDRANGNRTDLMELMAGMKPAFLRMPGGNYVEGNTIATRYEWKKTIGDLAQRAGHPGTWNYRSSDGLGLLEYLEWCEDLNMQPVLAVWAGYALNHERVAPGPALAPYVQEALDEIEYVTGDATTKWGAERVKDGHPAPFKLTYVEIGNEDFFDRSGSYDGRYSQFYEAIKAKYPALQLIATTPVNSMKPDVVDDHYYRPARAMEADVHHYDNTDRSGPKIFVGEWASREGNPTPTMNAALGDAAWLIGLERNSDLVVMEAYAPLFVNVNRGGMQWATDLIGYDALNSFGSPSYYVQSMYGQNHGEVLLPVDLQAAPDDSSAQLVSKGAIGVATWDTQAEFKDIKVTHGGDTLLQSDFTQGRQGWRTRGGGTWTNGDGVLAQTGSGQGVIATAGDPNWTNYTYELKARKTGGAEGFLILFHVESADTYVWWNLGGWGNTYSAIERSENGAKETLESRSEVTIDTGRWYDIRIDVQDRAIRCYLDGRLITTATDKSAANPDPVYVDATGNPASGDVFLHVANVSAAARTIDVNLKGVTTVAGQGTCIVLTGDPGDVNTLAEPQKVAPQSTALTGLKPTFTHEFPAHSVTVLRVNAH